MKRLWLLVSQCSAIFLTLWLSLSVIGPFDMNWAKTTESSTSNPYRFATQTALPSVVYLFTTSRQGVCGQESNEAKTSNSSTSCSIKSKDRRHLGSAVIIRSNGLLVTNYHVIMNKREIFAALDDGRNLPVKIIRVNPDADLALIEIKANNLPQISFGNPKDMQIGDSVLAIGNPFGLGKSVSMGIIAAMNKSKLGINKNEDFIQTDTTVNPGDSGGALVNIKGQLIGINSAIYSQHESSTGISFAIPLWMVAQELDSLPKKRSSN